MLIAHHCPTVMNICSSQTLFHPDLLEWHHEETQDRLVSLIFLLGQFIQYSQLIKQEPTKESSCLTELLC